jgi:threonyl-tRNA synthetase
MAQAVLEMFPEGKLAIGPAIERGFYYDFDLPRPLTPEDLEQIEKRMRQIIGQNQAFERREVSEEEARELFADQPYKLELIDGIVAGGVDEDGEPLPEGEKPVLSVYEHGDFIDLCAGPHVESTGKINPSGFKLLNVAGAYWRGDEKRPMLQRIYGTAWKNKKELKKYLEWLEEMEARDHRRLNRQLDLFTTSEDVGSGLIIYGPKAGRLRTTVEDFWRSEHFDGGYEILYTPHIGRGKLWETSGHLGFFKENMYAPLEIEGQEYYLKPMNCPFHIQWYKTETRSYRDLPLRWAELGTVYRYERSGVLHGLMRVRGFTQDDAHIFCTPEQIEDEMREVLRFSLHIWHSFGFHDLIPYLSTRPEKAIGDPERWEQAESVLKKILDESGLDYKVDEGGGAFYGPKIDIKVKDSLGREWQMTTIQFDFNLPERFEMAFVDQSNEERRPYMVHRALLGSWERFFGLLIEHYAGAFPVWLMPVQAEIIPITDDHIAYADEVLKKLKAAGIRAEVDDSGDRMGNKIRKAQEQKIPYMLVIGDREIEAGAVAVRLRSEENLGAMPVDDFIAMAKAVIESKSVELKPETA